MNIAPRKHRPTLLAGLMFTAAVPIAAPAQLTCQSAIGITVAPAGPIAAGETQTVTLTLGAQNIQGGSRVKINRLRYELDCDPNSGAMPCRDQGDVFSYLGDETILTDCPTAWSSNLPAGGNLPNEIVFAASTPFDITANTAASCSLSFGIGIDKAEPSVSGLTEIVAAFSSVDGDAMCDNGLASLGSEAAGVQLLAAPRAASNRRFALNTRRRR